MAASRAGSAWPVTETMLAAGDGWGDGWVGGEAGEEVESLGTRSAVLDEGKVLDAGAVCPCSGRTGPRGSLPAPTGGDTACTSGYSVGMTGACDCTNSESILACRCESASAWLATASLCVPSAPAAPLAVRRWLPEWEEGRAAEPGLALVSFSSESESEPPGVTMPSRSSPISPSSPV